MKFIIEILVIVAFIAAFIYAVGLIFGKKSDKNTSTPLEDLEKKADEVAKDRDEVKTKADEVEKKASGIKDKLK